MSNENYPEEVEYFGDNLSDVYDIMIVERNEERAIQALEALDQVIQQKFPEKSLLSIFKYKTEGYDRLLYLAAEYGFKAFIEKMITYGDGHLWQYPNPDFYNWTPLYYAANSQHKDVCDLLIAYGAIPDAMANDLFSRDITDFNNSTEVRQKWEAIENDSIDLSEEENEEEINEETAAKIFTVLCEKKEITEEQLISSINEGAYINFKDVEKNTPLMECINDVSELQTIKLLLSYGAEIPEDWKKAAPNSARERVKSQQCRRRQFYEAGVFAQMEDKMEDVNDFIDRVLYNKGLLLQALHEKNWKEIEEFISHEDAVCLFNFLSEKSENSYSVLEELYQAALKFKKDSQDYCEVKNILYLCKRHHLIKPIFNEPYRKKFAAKLSNKGKQEIADIICLKPSISEVALTDFFIKDKPYKIELRKEIIVLALSGCLAVEGEQSETFLLSRDIKLDDNILGLLKHKDTCITIEDTAQGKSIKVDLKNCANNIANYFNDLIAEKYAFSSNILSIVEEINMNSKNADRDKLHVDSPLDFIGISPEQVASTLFLLAYKSALVRFLFMGGVNRFEAAKNKQENQSLQQSSNSLSTVGAIPFWDKDLKKKESPKTSKRPIKEVEDPEEQGPSKEPKLNDDSTSSTLVKSPSCSPKHH